MRMLNNSALHRRRNAYNLIMLWDDDDCTIHYSGIWQIGHQIVYWLH